MIRSVSGKISLAVKLMTDGLVKLIDRIMTMAHGAGWRGVGVGEGDLNEADEGKREHSEGRWEGLVKHTDRRL